MDILSKILVSIVIVLLLAEITKRVNPLLGGILAGLPLGAGLSVYFVSASAGIEFVTKGIPWAIAGVASSILFCLGYLMTGKSERFKSNLLNTLVSSLSGICSFFIFALIIRQLQLNIWTACAIFIFIYLINIFAVNKIPGIKKGGTSSKASSFAILLLRGAVVGIIITIITGIATLVGARWTGILSSFPSTLFPLLLVLQYEEGNKLYPGVIYGFSYSAITLVIFYISCLLLLPRLGLNLGFIAIYAISFLFIYFFNRLLNSVRSKSNADKAQNDLCAK